jgi:hypothetical protein
VILRLLGYPSRVVSGLYASPDRYNPRTRHTSVLGEDAHFWAEVRLPSGVWIPIEPTPGYSLMGPVLSWGEKLADAIRAAFRWAGDHWMGIAASGIALALVARLRHELADIAVTLAWRLAPRRDPSRHLVRTFRLIERRSRWAGNPRPGFATPRRWYGTLAPLVEAGQAGGFADVLGSLDLVLYAPGRSSHREWPGGVDPTSSCRRVVETWTLSRLRAVRRGVLS